MNKKIVESYLADAIQVIADKKAEEEKKDTKRELTTEDGKIKKVFKGYMASFGPSIIQSGLAPTLVFYMDSGANSEENRSIIVELITELLIKKGKLEQSKDFLSEVLAEQVTKKEVEAAAVAIKLAFRVFEFESNLGKEEA